MPDDQSGTTQVLGYATPRGAGELRPLSRALQWSLCLPLLGVPLTILLAIVVSQVGTMSRSLGDLGESLIQFLFVMAMLGPTLAACWLTILSSQSLYSPRWCWTARIVALSFVQWLLVYALTEHAAIGYVALGFLVSYFPLLAIWLTFELPAQVRTCFLTLTLIGSSSLTSAGLLATAYVSAFVWTSREWEFRPLGLFLITCGPGALILLLSMGALAGRAAGFKLKKFDLIDMIELKPRIHQRARKPRQPK